MQAIFNSLVCLCLFYKEKRYMKNNSTANEHHYLLKSVQRKVCVYNGRAISKTNLIASCTDGCEVL